jgi:hypothetical protein
VFRCEDRLTAERLAESYVCDLVGSADAVKASATGTHLVYFVQSKQGLVKIGYTQNLKNRMAGLGAGRVLLRTIGFPSKAQALQAERAYHLWLGRDNSHSEWFYPTDDVMACAIGLKDPPRVVSM